MWWSRRLSPCVLAATLVFGALTAATRLPASPQEAASTVEETEDAQAEESTRAERKAERKAKRAAERSADETASAAPVVDQDAEAEESPADPTDEPAGESDSDSDSDADLPGLLILSSDATATVIVNGELGGRLEPGERLEVRVDLGEIAIRALSVDAVGASWEKTLELEEPGVESVRIRMSRAVRKFRREERKSGVFRDRRHELMWPKRDNGRDVDLRRAYAYCRDLSTGGFEDWRLPTLEELESLEALWERSGYKILGDIFLSECCVWSSEYDGSQRAWTFNYRFRKAFETNAGYSFGLRALCVRPWDPEAEPERAAEETAEIEPSPVEEPP